MCTSWSERLKIPSTLSEMSAVRDGSGTFSASSTSVEFESTEFSAGRLVKKSGSVGPEYHVNDYLCSVRVVTDADGEVLERNDYSGFRKRLASSVTSPAGRPLTLWQKSIPASARMSTATAIR